MPVADEAVDALEFGRCLPDGVARAVLQARLADEAAVTEALHQPIGFVRS